MPNRVKLKRSYTAGAVPATSDLETNECAINWTDGKLFVKDLNGSIVTLTLGGGSYTLPTASSSTLGGIRVGSGLSISSGVLSASDSRWDLFLPAAPTGVTATAGNASATLSWTAPTGVIAQAPITDYREQYSADNGTTWTNFTAAASTATSATVTGLTNGTAYRFRVAAVNAVGVGAYTAASAAVTPVAGDALFSSVQLLLHGDTSIADASAYSRSVTASGGAAVSTAQKKFGAGSIAFNGGAGTVVAAANAGYNLGSGDWVIEGWVYFNSVAADQRVAGGDRPLNNDGYNWAWYTTTSGRLDYYLSSNGSSWNLASGVPFGTIAANQWYHVALVRSGGTVKPYLNGTAGTTSSVSGSIYNNTSNGPFIGSQGDSYFNGFIDDFRYTVGSNRGYTGSTITVPTAAFPTVGPSGVAIDGYFSSVSLLLPGDTSTADMSSYSRSVTAVGAAVSTAQKRWGAGSIYFDGSGDYLTIPSSTALDFGGGNFVVEAWFKTSQTTSEATLLCREWVESPWTNAWTVHFLSSGVIRIFATSYSTSSPLLVGSTPCRDGNWHHFAWVRSGSTHKLFIDGAVDASAESAFPWPSATKNITVGNDLTFGSGSRAYEGYIDDLRITVGSDRGMTGSTITVPTAALPTSGPMSAPTSPVTLSTPYGAVTGSGTVGSKWAWQSGSGFSSGTSAKLLTATASVTVQATLANTGGGNCDSGESRSLGIYSAANARIRTMSSGAESLTAGQYIQMELDCAHGLAEVWVV